MPVVETIRPPLRAELNSKINAVEKDVKDQNERDKLILRAIMTHVGMIDRYTDMLSR